MLNWRKPLIYTALALSGYPVFRYFRYLKSIEYKSPEELQELQNQKLQHLLKHAYENVPYYNKVLVEAGVLKNGKVILDNFYRIPPLTKKILREQGDNLLSKDHKKRGSYRNTSGGSTGEPVKFIQDKDYKAWGLAYRLLYNQWAGKEVGQPEIKLWGSERDVLEKADKLSTRIRRWGFHLKIMNSFMMDDINMSRYVKKWNRFKPQIVWAYMNSICELARFIKRKNIKIFKPASIISTAETLTENVRTLVEEVFECPLLNQYGSREIGIGGCECTKKEGIHIFPLHNKIEILNEHMSPCKPGQAGKVLVTTLNNFSMPLIRYDIGDMAIPAHNEQCSCGRSFPLIKNVVGRHVEAFRTRDGRTIPGEFFIHFVGVVYNKDFVKRFQVVQKDYDLVVVRIVISDKKKFDEYKPELINSIKKVMGADCKVEFEYVDDIQVAKSGKYLYTLCEIPEEKNLS